MKLELTNLTKTFQDITAVNQVSLSMGYGIYGLLGVNGAGKTTLMRMLGTLITPTSGSITCDGEDIFEMGKRYRQLLGYLPQEFGFYPEFSVQDYLQYIASIKGIRPQAAKVRIRQLLEQVGLSQVKQKKMKKLSGGMKRRVGIAQAMLNDPKILILDEPTAGLDPGERIRFRNLLGELAKERLVLLSTHIVSDVEYIANQILCMKDGKIVHAGTQEEILREAPVRVWILTVPEEQAGSFQRAYQVSNVRHSDGEATLRLISGDCPGEGAAEENPTLEDLFLYYFGEKGDRRDDLL